jgi:16S rRNA (guanine1516-N2)-methyltransferase
MTTAYELIRTPDYLGLQKTDGPDGDPFYIDFLAGKLAYRSQQASLRKEALARALGCSPRDNALIVDATAGLGRDSFILATLGFKVTAIERSPILYTLLNDALERAKRDADMASTIDNITLIQANAIDWLQTTALTPRVIYIDPMFPDRKKSALVKKEMVILQDLLGKDTDSEQLFTTALGCATHRVVVKRPRLAPQISAKSPNYSLTGKSSRFDIYLV